MQVQVRVKPKGLPQLVVANCKVSGQDNCYPYDLNSTNKLLNLINTEINFKP
jgi:hypothetical protein